MISFGKVKVSPIIFVAFMSCSALWGPETSVPLFLSLLIHEAAHYIVLRHFGCMVTSFEILPFGAKLVLEDIAEEWWKKILIYGSAPFVNLFLAICSACFSLCMHSDFLDFLVFYNVVLFVVNLLPISPLDMSKMLCALLCQSKRPIQSAKIVFYCSLLCSSFLFFVSLFLLVRHGVVFLLFLSVFFLYHTFKELQNALHDYSVRASKRLECVAVSPCSTKSKRC